MVRKAFCSYATFGMIWWGNHCSVNNNNRISISNLMATKIHNLHFLIRRYSFVNIQPKNIHIRYFPQIYLKYDFLDLSFWICFFCPLMFTSSNLSFLMRTELYFAKNNFSLAIYFKESHHLIRFLFLSFENHTFPFLWFFMVVSKTV